MWVTVQTRADGARIQKKVRGNAWATVYENVGEIGKSTWAVYVKSGKNEVASGGASTFCAAKLAASFALLKVAG
jgi:hypothetical protein